MSDGGALVAFPKLGLNTSTLMPYQLALKISAAARAGFRHLELRSPEIREFLRANELADLCALLSAHDLEVASVNALEFVTYRHDDYDAVLAECGELCGWAAVLGSPIVIAVPGPVPVWTTPWSEIRSEAVRVLNDLANIAASDGVTIGFEPLGFGWCTVRTVAGACQILEDVAHENVALVLDLAHFHLGGSRLREIDQLDGSRLPIVHVDDVEDGPLESLTDADRVFPGAGCLPIDAILAKIATVGFTGVLSVELFRPEYWDWTPDEICRRAYASASAVCEQHFPAISG
jgi:2-keto-myo-inositol isomerase